MCFCNLGKLGFCFGEASPCKVPAIVFPVTYVAIVRVGAVADVVVESFGADGVTEFRG